jgi:hypothetical protein
MELEETSTSFDPPADRRPHIPQPPPVKLVAVADVELATVAGREREMDQFYLGLFSFERDGGPFELVYRAENFRLRFQVLERPGSRDELRPTGVTVPSLSVLMAKLDEHEIQYTRQRGFGPGQESLLLRDPAGNWLEISEMTLFA